MKATIKIRSASVIQVPHGADQVRLVIAAPSTSPDQHWDPTIEIQVAQGYGREWLKRVFGIELTAGHDRLAANPDMSVFERSLEEEPCGYCGTPIDLTTSPPRNRKGDVFCDAGHRKKGKDHPLKAYQPSTYPPCRTEDRLT